MAIASAIGAMGTPFMFDGPVEPKGPTGSPKASQGALEETLLNVKKNLWDIERHTSETQSRLDKNNQSGPSYPLYQISKWGESAVLDMMLETLVEIQDTLENSSIARHSKSPLEKSLDNIREATVSFNEKTSRWHDVQTNLMVKGSDPRVQAAKLKSKPSDEMVTKKKTGIGVLAGFLKEIAESNSLIAKALAGTAEDKLEGTAAAAKAAKEEKKQTGIFGGMLEALKKTAVGSWLIDNWKMIAATLFVLFAPLKWIKKLWGWAKTFWDMPIWGKLLTVLGGLGLYFGSKAGIAKLFGMAKTSFAEKGMAGLKPGAGMTKALGAGAILAGIALAIKDGFAGAKLSEEWGVGKASGVAGAVLGGTSKGLEGAMANMGKWALIGAGIGSFVPVIGTLIGGVIGAVVGAVLGWIGGERIAKFFTATGQLFKDVWTGFTDGIELMVDDFKVYLIDPIINIFKAMKDWATGMLKKLAPDWLLKKLGVKVDKPIKDTGEYAEGPTPDDIKTKVAEKGLSKGAWVQQQAGGGGAKESAWRKSMGGNVGVKQAYKDYKAGFSSGTTPPTSSTPPVSTPPVSTSHPVQPSSIPHKTITTTPSGEDIHKAVKVSQADMSGVSWSKLGGRDTIEGIILNTWNQAGVSAAPTFTSGFRNKDHKASLKNPNSKHIQKTAFDLRSKDLGSKADGIFASLMSAFQPLGLWGQHEKGDVNSKNRTGEHFHFQLAARGFEGIVGKDGPRGFIAGEAGEELVRIQPLVSPDDKMNAMNALNAENQTVRGGQSGSPTIISTTNAQATTNNSTGGVYTLNNPVAAPRLTTSLPS